MSPRLHGLASRLLALLLLAVAAAAPVLLGLALLDELSASNAALVEQRRLLGRLEAATAEMRSAVEAGEAAPDIRAAGLFAGGESEGVALAALQTHLGEEASAAGLKLQSAAELPSRREGALSLIGLRIDLSGPIDDLARLLHEIESGEPAMVIEATRLRPSQEEGAARIEASLDVMVAMAAPGKGED